MTTQTTATLKQCCAAVYQSRWAPLLLGESYHPGGLNLTRRLGQLLQLGPGDRVLDIASGPGSSARCLAQTFGCTVVGVDYGRDTVIQANQATADARLARQVTFAQADAEQLPFPDAAFDAVLCECAFCTFPHKSAAAAEMHRVLKPNGRVGLSDLTRHGRLPAELETLIAWVACIADARPLAGYSAILQSAGLTITHSEPHDDALAALLHTVRGKLLAAEIMHNLGRIDLPQAEFAQAKQLARSAATAVRQGRLGYALLIGQKKGQGKIGAIRS